MGKFITGNELEEAVCDIIWEAETHLFIVSPFIKLDNYFKKLFDKHQHNHELAITVIFGKNENKVHKSLSKEDFDFFKKFPNITIIYVPELHGKYYGNEQKGVITSINLYDYSFKNNIEFGVFSEQTILNSLTDRFTTNADKDAWNTCWNLAEENDIIFVRRPVYENKTFIINLGKNYLKSETLVDYTDYFYGRINKKYKPLRLDDFPEYISANDNKETKPAREDIEEPKKKKIQKVTGYCIRTGENIPFNPNQPLSKEAWKIWSQFSNVDFPEKYCHKTGKPSYGKTSMRNPILD